MQDPTGQLLADPFRPLGLVELAALTAPWVTLEQWGQWHRRGLLTAPRWTVGGRPCWSATDALVMLSGIALHFLPDGRALRCGRTCADCKAGDRPSTWTEHWRQLERPA